MPNLRNQIIRLAHEHPELRTDLLSILKEAGCEKLPEGGMRENCEKKVEEGKDKKEAGCEKLPEGGMRDNCEKKVEEGKKTDKSAASLIRVNKMVTLLVRILQGRKMPTSVMTGFPLTWILGQISLDFGTGLPPRAIRFEATVGTTDDGYAQVVTFEPVKSVSGGGIGLLLSVFKAALQEALNKPGVDLSDFENLPAMGP
jgi:hypothetical protein